MKYLFLSLISALLLSISWPTYGVPFFIFVALVPLLMMEQDIARFSNIKHKGWAIFGLSYLCFFIWNAVTTGWLYGAKNPDGTPSIMAVAFPVLVNALLYALVFWGYYRYKKAMGTYWGLGFLMALWLSFEKFHLSWEFSWPWLNLGNAFANYPKLIQWYDTLGATGGSFWVLSLNLFIFYALRTWEAGRKRKVLFKNIVLILAFIFVPMLGSLYKYHSFNEQPVGKVSVLMLQPDLDPYTEKYSKDRFTILNDLLTLARTEAKVDYYLAPETALPGNGSFSEEEWEQNPLLAEIKSFLSKQKQAIFVSGAASHRYYHHQNEAPNNAYPIPNTDIWVENYNTAIQLLPHQAVETYHKGKLVPGVEIFPYISVLKPILGDAMLNFGGTVSSLGMDTERKVFKNPYNRGIMAPIICYESIYGEFVTEYVKNGANFLGIMTNDSWWGKTQGHQQLLAYAQLRAIETRREIARAANSGISAHINALGEIEQDTLYGDKTALFAEVQLYEGQSFYTRAGDVVSRLGIFALGFLIFYLIYNKVEERLKAKRLN